MLAPADDEPVLGDAVQGAALGHEVELGARAGALLVLRELPVEDVQRVAAAAPARTAPLRSSAAESVAPTIGTPVLGKGDLDDLASLGEVDTGAPDGTPDDPLDILDRQLPEDEEHSGSGAQLYLMAENGALDRIAKDRFVIGRGKHCDFIINSGKVSREHAVIVRDEGAYYIEDLGSSNGTWFNKQRIKRKQVEDGDEFFICNEKIKLVLR